MSYTDVNFIKKHIKKLNKMCSNKLSKKLTKKAQQKNLPISLAKSLAKSSAKKLIQNSSVKRFKALQSLEATKSSTSKFFNVTPLSSSSFMTKNY